ncbi:AAA family ATPase [Mesorhizobium sp. INR15]|uniref:AAA family ATPase n=1 Tax=Mesorhizobium sp. INR15 TaxID=2654248 RepID=UPI0018969C94|nr:AAA family ATPase [Mesorhizobium sp. INR15]QPC91657.1 AAA family ATPase [Mesorhizobium sp. INR15]
MIIEFFGPPASGKTTLAHALASRLRDRGYMAKVILCYQPRSRGEGWDFLGIFSVGYRMSSAAFSVLLVLFSSFWERYEIKISAKLLNIMPPESIKWRARIWQYIIRLSRCWKQAQRSTNITIFDQGFVQAIGSLAMFNSAADDALIAQALQVAPQADLVVRIIVPRDVVETRLRARMTCEAAAERLLEVDIADNMNAFRVFDDIGEILVSAHRNIVSIQSIDQQSSSSGLRQVEEEILARLSLIEVSAISKGRERNDLPAKRRLGKNQA